MSYEKHLALDLVARLADRFGPASKVAKELPGWLEYLTEVECPERPKTRPGAIWWNKIRDLARSVVPAARGGEGELVLANATRLGAHFRLPELEVRILCFVVFYKLFESFEHVVDGALETREVTLPLLLAQFCDCDETAVRAALRADQRLRSSGLLHYERRHYVRDLPYAISDRLCMAMLADVDDLDGLIALMFPSAPAPEAEWRDFEGLGGQAGFMRDLLARALAAGTPGVNILLYGPPGTGKTEFAKVLAREVSAHLRAIGEADVNGEEPSGRERLTELGIAGRMLGARRDTVLLFDEMEDLFGGPTLFFGQAQPSKVHNNRLLETNPIPTIWTTNSIATCDPAVLRRMTYSVQMRPPSGRVRGRIWQRLEARHASGIASEALSRLAETHDHAPALVSDAMRVARLCEGGEDVVGQVLGAASRLANGGADPSPKHHTEVPWQAGLANADTDLTRLEGRLSHSDASYRVSFCLEGPAGTGKSAWARHLARVMGLPVLEKRASDLMSMWVGGTEQNIARAFSDARSDGALLIFDEADSLLSDRRDAERSWEISQVNEMLTWMESHPLPFVCTTNFAEKLDPATQRRFTFRIRFDWLKPAQLPLAWAVHFGGEVPAGLRILDRLTPGDFANVARRMRALAENDPRAILLQLAREVEGKEGTPRPIGFGR
ncbi:AAA+-type ATPase, SpoVK/Ycf46/Vps4 family [Paracoccus halophilus]|uniref:AAA+-type ATPase, SpoVK/Ycf46/Vps4 family n=1 Tax=Paracoccus halophilus TaxID=376733 RepID=A0A1I0UDP4_9RHOB|nr:AAA family ATPase [Paracoccus halophilus]SFA62003.1 AAA+-type ATPase, SpoVK/Ycf46/Vps4 family [Paracoccus halophilus]